MIARQCNVPVALKSAKSRWCTILGVTALTYVMPSCARDARASGTFEVPDHCGTREQFEASIRARVDSREAESILGALSLRIREQPGTYAFTMQVGHETRYLQDHDCTELFRAAVVVAIALWEAPARSESSPVAQEGSTSTLPGTLESSGTPLPRLLPTTARILGPLGHVWRRPGLASRSLKLQPGAESGMTVGLQPKLGPFIGVQVAIEAASFGVHSSLRWLPARGERDAHGRGVEVAAIGARVAGYYAPTRSLALELGVGVYHLNGTGLGSAQNVSAGLWTVGPLVGLWFTPLRWGSVFLAVGAEGQLALSRPSFEITGYAKVFRVSRMFGTTYLAAGYRFE